MSKKERSKPNEPVDYVLDGLWDLITRINTHDKKHLGNNMLEKYDYFARHGKQGRNCTYGLKAKQMFMIYDWPDVKKQLKKIVEYIRTIPGSENFAK